MRVENTLFSTVLGGSDSPRGDLLHRLCREELIVAGDVRQADDADRAPCLVLDDNPGLAVSKTRDDGQKRKSEDQKTDLNQPTDPADAHGSQSPPVIECLPDRHDGRH